MVFGAPKVGGLVVDPKTEELVVAAPGIIPKREAEVVTGTPKPVLGFGSVVPPNTFILGVVLAPKLGVGTTGTDADPKTGAEFEFAPKLGAEGALFAPPKLNDGLLIEVSPKLVLFGTSFVVGFPRSNLKPPVFGGDLAPPKLKDGAEESGFPPKLNPVLDEVVEGAPKVTVF